MSVVKKEIDVVGAVVIAEGRVLCLQRGPGGRLPGMWEFPGGKVEPNETPQHALRREVEEELLCHVTIGDEVTTTTHEYDFAVVKLTTFFCELTHGAPQLTEHSKMVWSNPDELDRLDWAPADIPAVALIKRHMTATPGLSEGTENS